MIIWTSGKFYMNKKYLCKILGPLHIQEARLLLNQIYFSSYVTKKTRRTDLYIEDSRKERMWTMSNVVVSALIDLTTSGLVE